MAYAHDITAELIRLKDTMRPLATIPSSNVGLNFSHTLQFLRQHRLHRIEIRRRVPSSKGRTYVLTLSRQAFNYEEFRPHSTLRVSSMFTSQVMLMNDHPMGPEEVAAFQKRLDRLIDDVTAQRAQVTTED